MRVRNDGATAIHGGVQGEGSVGSTRASARVWLYGFVVFAAAWLVFWIQPLAVRGVLPVLGGSPAVWNTAMVFFQSALLAGYAGLVAITGACAYVEPWAAVLFFGFLPGVVVVFSVLMFDQLQIDDPVGAISVHGVSGALGTVLLGLFHTDSGLLYGGGVDLLMAQLVGVVGVFAFCMICGLVLFNVIKSVVGLRASREAELVGLDAAEHGNDAYPEFGVSEVARSQQRGPRPGP